MPKTIPFLEFTAAFFFDVLLCILQLLVIAPLQRRIMSLSSNLVFIEYKQSTSCVVPISLHNNQPEGEPMTMVVWAANKLHI